jgi:hypothetical protein
MEITYPEFSPIDCESITNNLLSQRQILMKKKLLEFTQKQHDTFLKRNKIKFDAVKSKTWHSSFNIENVKAIPKQILSFGNIGKKRW